MNPRTKDQLSPTTSRPLSRPFHRLLRPGRRHSVDAAPCATHGIRCRHGRMALFSRASCWPSPPRALWTFVSTYARRVEGEQAAKTPSSSRALSLFMSACRLWDRDNSRELTERRWYYVECPTAAGSPRFNVLCHFEPVLIYVTFRIMAKSTT